MTITHRKGLWPEAIKALNHVPNTRLPYSTMHEDTYALVAAMERAAADPVEYELEIATFGMVRDSEGSHLSEGRSEEPDFWDVQLQLRLDNGQIEILLERENLSLADATSAADALAIIFPDASMTIWPE